jgi:uncharacterized integral membrane protein
MTARQPNDGTRDPRLWLRVAGIVVVLGLLIAFFVQNDAEVNIELLWWGWRTPLAVGLIATAVLGVVLGWLGTRFGARIRRH